MPLGSPPVTGEFYSGHHCCFPIRNSAHGYRAQGSGAEETSPSSTADGSAAQTKATTTKTKATTAGTSSGAQQSNKLSSSNKLFSEPLTLTLLLGEHVNQPIKANTVKFQELQELTNVTLDIDVTPSSAYDAKLIASMASGKLYDLQKIDISQMRKYSTDLYLDVTDRMKTQVPNYYERIKNDNVFKQTSINGDITASAPCLHRTGTTASAAPSGRWSVRIFWKSII